MEPESSIKPFTMNPQSWTAAAIASGGAAWIGIKALIRYGQRKEEQKQIKHSIEDLHRSISKLSSLVNERFSMQQESLIEMRVMMASFPCNKENFVGCPAASKGK